MELQFFQTIVSYSDKKVLKKIVADLKKLSGIVVCYTIVFGTWNIVKFMLYSIISCKILEKNLRKKDVKSDS